MEHHCYDDHVHKINGIECLYTNTDVLNNKLDEMTLFINKRNIQLIAVTEILPKNKIYDGDYKPDFILPGFTCFPNYDGRGVALFVKENLEVKILNEYDELHTSSIICKIKLPNDDHVIVIVCYRSPNCDDAMNEKINTLISDINNRFNKNKVLIMGDFNFPSIDWNKEISDKNEHHKASKFLSCVHKNYLTQHVKKPTHHRGNQNPTLIDLILTNEEDLIHDLKYHPPLGSSHHLVLTFTINASNTAPIMKEVPKKQFNKADYDQMRTYMTRTEKEWDRILNDDQSLDDWEGTLVGMLDSATDKYVPSKCFNNGKQRERNFHAPETLLSAMQMKRQAFKLKTKYRSQTNENLYIYYRNKVNSLVRKAKRAKEMKVAKEVKTNPKALFKYIASKNKTKEKIPDLDKGDGTYTETDLEKVNLLSDYFKSVYTTEGTSNIPKVSADLKSKLSNITISQEQILTSLRSLNPNKSPGPDKVHPKILKELSEQLQYPVWKLFNRSLKEGRIPRRWKIAEVRPIFKKGSKTAPGNYRPVSLTSVLCKLLEGFIRHALYEHLVDNKLLAKEQFGFCKGRTCTSQLLVTISEWLTDLDNNIPVDCAYLDFRKAFDSVPHQRLMAKLKGYGIDGSILNWINDFLNNRTQYVAINDVQSASGAVTSGVPQGSVLGPTLFIYFINDLPSVTKCPKKIFADDTKAHKGIQTPADRELLQSAIHAMVEWSIKWQLGFNGEKCAMLHLGKNNPRHKYSIKHNNDIIDLKITECEKDLGVNIDPLLKYEEHMTKQVKKPRGMAAMIFKSIK